MMSMSHDICQDAKLPDIQEMGVYDVLHTWCKTHPAMSDLSLKRPQSFCFLKWSHWSSQYGTKLRPNERRKCTPSVVSTQEKSDSLFAWQQVKIEWWTKRLFLNRCEMILKGSWSTIRNQDKTLDDRALLKFSMEFIRTGREAWWWIKKKWKLKEHCAWENSQQQNWARRQALDLNVYVRIREAKK